MHVRVLSIGGKTQTWVAEAWAHFAKRLPPAWGMELVEVPSARQSPRQPGPEVKGADAARLDSLLRSGERVVALDEGGRCLDSLGFARCLEEWFGAGRDIAFVIGGPDGLAAEFLTRADFRWSLSPLTFPHEMVRMLLVEQLYRASTILSGHPYHRV